MVVTLGGLAAQRPAVVYRPAPVGLQQRGRPVGPRQDTSRGVSTQPTAPEAVMRLLAKLNNDPGVQAAAQKRAEEEAQQQAEEATPWYKKGLGMVLGNPLVKTALVPLGAMGTLGRAGTLGVEELSKRIHEPDWLDKVGQAFPVSGLGLVLNANNNLDREDKRSNVSKVFSPQSDYGYGQLINQDMPDWYKRTVGLAGDVAFDPLTYVAPGATRTVGAVEKGAKTAEAVAARAAANEAAAEATALASSGADQMAIHAAAHEATVQDTLARWLEKAAEDVNVRPGVPLHQGRKAREAFLGELAQYAPELLKGESGRALTRGAERGFNTIKDEALREAVGLERPGLRFASARIPGTEGLTRGLAGVGGVARVGANRAPLLGTTMEKFSSRGLEESSRVLSRGAKGDVLKAATTVRIQNLMRRGLGEFQSRANNELRQLAKSLRKDGVDEEGIRALFREAETGAGPNKVNEFFGYKLPEIYAKITKTPMVPSSTIGADNYVPHLMTPEFKRFLEANRRDVTVEEYLDAGNFIGDDLLEGSHHLDKERRLKPDQIGVPKEIDIAGRTMTLTDGSIDELNDQLAIVFPEFKGKAYMDDPIQIGEAYISSVARQAGRDKAMLEIARSTNPHVLEVAGELLKSVETRNAFLRTNPVADMIRSGYAKGQALIPAGAKGDMPTTPHDALFAVTKHEAETQAQQDFAYKEGRSFVNAVTADVEARRTTLSDTLKGVRDAMKSAFKKRETASMKTIKDLNRVLDNLSDEVKKLGPLTSENVNELVAIRTTVESKIVDVKAEIKKINDLYGKKIPRDLQAAERELRNVLRDLNKQADDIKRLYAQGTDEMRQEAAERLERLTKPVTDAEAELERAKMAARAKPEVGLPPSPARVQAAHVKVRQGFLTEEGFEAEREMYHNAVRVLQEEGVPLYKTTAGTLTPESLDVVEQTVAELKAVEVPPETPGVISSATPEQRLRQSMARAQQAKADVPLAPEAEVPLAPEAVAPEPPAAVPEVAPEPPVDTRLLRLAEGVYGSDDGYSAVKTSEGWSVAHDEEDLGFFDNLNEAKAEIKRRQEQGATLEETAGAGVPAENVEPVVPEPPTPKPEAPARAAARRRRWLKRKPQGREIFVGPDGWTIEPYTAGTTRRQDIEALRAEGGLPTTRARPEPPAPVLERGKWKRSSKLGEPVVAKQKGWKIEQVGPRLWGVTEPKGDMIQGRTIGDRWVPIRSMHEAQDVAAQMATAKAPVTEAKAAAVVETAATEAVEQPTRYVARHPTDEGMRSTSFDTADEAKRAVEQMLAKREAKVTMEQYWGGDLRAWHEATRRSNDKSLTSAEREAAKREAKGLAAGAFGRGETVTVDTLTNAREFPPSTLTPEGAAANRAAAEAAPGVRRPEKAMNPEPVARELDPRAAEVLRNRPPTRTNDAIAYERDWQAWQQALADSKEGAMAREGKPRPLTDAERAANARRAKTLGAPFTQKNGKYYNRRASNRLIIQQAVHDANVAADEGVQAAEARLAKAQAQAESQAEAMVYLAERNLGIDYTRLPSGSTIGFGEGATRRAVLPEPPSVAHVIDDSRVPPEERPWTSSYSPGDRARDRSIIESGMAAMMPDNGEEYDRLILRKQGIHEQLDNAARNEDELRQLDEAAKAAYTDGVRQADQAVAAARLAEDRARPHADSVPGAADAYAQAQRVTAAAVEHQTEVRQAWMEADRAWQEKLAERDEYLKVTQRVSKAERVIHHHTEAQAHRIIETVRQGEIPLSGGKPIKDSYLNDAIQELQRADIELDEFNKAGYTYLTENERTVLAGQLVDIDKKQRDLINQLMPHHVKDPDAILPPLPPEPGQFATSTFGETPPPQRIPPALSGRDPLQERAYAESFESMQPGEDIQWTQTPEGAWIGKPRLKGRQPYNPITEREAIARLEQQANVREATTEAQAPELQRELGNIARQKQAESVTREGAKAEQELLSRASQNEALLPLKDQIQTYTIVRDAMEAKEKVIPLRDQAIADGRAAAAIKTGKKADLVRAASEIEALAKQNPTLADVDMAKTEALLIDAQREAKIVNENDLSGKQAQAFIDAVSDPRDSSVDIMLTTVGRNSKMLYEAKGGKKAVLQAGDIIVDAELHKRFTNMYDLKKDRVLFGRTFNAFTNLFKTYATLTPGFHVRNALSAIFMNTSDGVPLATQFRAAGIWREYMEGGEDWLGQQSQKIQDAFAAAHTSGAGGRFTEAGFAEYMDEGAGWVKWMERVQRNKVTRLSQRVGERVEGSVRLAMAMHSMDIGDSVESAVQRINRIHFDYGDVSKLDEAAKRMIPFWTFMSRNMPMQVSQMWTHPQAYLTYQKFVKNFSAENEELTPEYWLKAGSWNTGLKVPQNSLPVLGAASGLPIYAQPDLGFTRLQSDLKDYEDFLSGKRFGGVLSNVNPLISAPVELATRTDVFTGQHFEPGETVPMGGPLGFIPKMVAGAFGQTEGGEVDAAVANFMRALNPLMDRQTRLLPQATGGDPEGMKRQAESWLRTMLGAPVRTLTPKQQESQFYNQYYDELNKVKQARRRAERQAG